jgi:nucleotide-binding universal stress UspA family protein
MLPRHILVPVDFSEPSQQALDVAIELAQAFQARLFLLHVVETPVMGGGPGEMGMGTAYAEVMKQMEAEASRNLEDYVGHVHKAGLECTGEIMPGAPFQQIVDVADHKQVDLIVMGTRGHTGLQRFFLGSVAEKVVRMAPCPVLVTRSEERENDA